MPHGEPSSSITYKWSYDVFLSFGGIDTRTSFSLHLFRALRQKGLRVFLDDEVIREVDDSIRFKAKHESRIAIIVFSENYSNSKFCLQELEPIIECFEGEGRWIYPVFYDEDSSGVRHQIWRLILSQAAALPVYYFLPGTMDVHECVGVIVEQVTALINGKEEGEEGHDGKKKKEGEEEEHDDKKNKEGEEEGNDDTIHETTDLSFWEKKERSGSYNVFLSYREAKPFVFPSLLHDCLHEGGLSVYRVPISDLITLNEKITNKSSKALHKSRVAIILFSKNYSDSVYRLKELIQILEYFKGEGRLIYPVFYDVDPLEALARLEKIFKDKRDQVEEWRRALSQPVDLLGYHDQVEEWRRVLSRPDDLPGYHFIPRAMIADGCIGAIVERVTAWMNEKDKFWVWDKGEEIGFGAFGNVYVARHWKTRAICGAVKELNIYKPDAADNIRKEIKFLSQLKKHPNIVEYYGHKVDEGPISIYMEYVQPGSLKNYMKKSGGKLDERTIQNFTAQILFGLVHLQNNNQVHRDLKPTNLLVNSKNTVKLVDFGLAKLIAKSVGEHSVEGTHAYAAPELGKKKQLNSRHEGVVADIWSLGCVIIEMFSGNPPLLSDSNLRYPCIPEELSQEGKDFLKRCFKIEPAERPFAEKLLEDPFVKAQAIALKNTGLYKD